MILRYSNSTGTNRYGGADPDFNGSEDYNLNHTTVNFVVNIQGSISDEDGDIAMSAAVVNSLFGNANDNETRVTSDGSYHIKAWVHGSMTTDIKFFFSHYIILNVNY